LSFYHSQDIPYAITLQTYIFSQKSLVSAVNSITDLFFNRHKYMLKKKEKYLESYKKNLSKLIDVPYCLVSLVKRSFIKQFIFNYIFDEKFVLILDRIS